MRRIMTENNLLVISNNFPNQDNSFAANVFVKEQINHLKNNFDNIYVISPVAYGVERVRGIPQINYQYDNISVWFPKYLNFLPSYFYGKSLWRYLQKRAIINLIEREKLSYDLIHAHFTWPSGAVAVDLKEKYNVPVIITEHTSNSIEKAIKSKDRHWIETWKKADAIIRVKKGDIALIEKMGIPKGNIFHIPNGYDQKFYSMDMSNCRETLGLPKDKKVLLNVGNLYGDVKGHKYLIEAISHIIQKRNDVLCVIVGAGKLRPTLECQICSLGLEEYVKLVGGKPHDEIPFWMNACDLFVLPSLRESFGVVQIEAMACGKPVVATRNGGSEEIVISEEYGLLVEPGDAEELAEKILVALDKKWDRVAILTYARKFSFETIGYKINSIYEKLFEEHHLKKD